MSNTLCFGLTSRRSGGIMLTASCRVMAPTSFAWTMNACSCRRCSLFFSASFGMSTCHASLSGYHARHLGLYLGAARRLILGKSSDTSLRDGLAVFAAHVDAEGEWEGLAEGGHHGVPLVGRHDSLMAVVLVELFVGEVLLVVEVGTVGAEVVVRLAELIVGELALTLLGTGPAAAAAAAAAASTAAASTAAAESTAITAAPTAETPATAPCRGRGLP